MPRGGKRPNAGRPKGSKEAPTLAKEAAREILRLKLTAELQPIADALVSRCKGVRYFVTRNKKTGKFELVTNPDRVIAALNRDDDESGEFYTDKPDITAIKEAFDRMVDKSKEQIQEIALSGEPLIAALLAGRERAAKRKKR